MIYSLSTVIATKLASDNKIRPQEAWEKAVLREFPNSISSQQKGCPKNTFLGLCEEGYIKGIKTGDYTRSELNKKYAIAAINILKNSNSNSISPIDLWKKVLKKINVDPDKQHNSQMNVILALWNERLIN